MKFLIISAVLVALCSARPPIDCLYPEHGSIIPAPAPLVRHEFLPAPVYPGVAPVHPVPAIPAPAPVVPAPAFPAPGPLVPTHEQYHSQDTFGQYQFGYNTPTSSRHEIHSLDGSSHGSYSYYDSNGVLQTVNYEAGPGGFHAAATNLPVGPVVPPAPELKPVTETPEVAKVRAELETLQQQIAAGNYPELPKAPEPPAVPEVPELKPVEDEPAVAAAKAEHLALKAKIEAGDVQLPVSSAPINLPEPEPVTDEPAVAKAKAEHLAIHKAVTDYDNWQKAYFYGAAPIAPIAPVAPVRPFAPVAPVAPVRPFAPVAPIAPFAPVAHPVAPVPPVAIAHPPVLSHEIKDIEIKPIVQQLPLTQHILPQTIHYVNTPYLPC